MLFKGYLKSREYRVGDLVYDQFYGIGVVIIIDESLCDMEVRFRKPEKNIFMDANTVATLTVVSRAEHRSPHNLR
jgi:hypothetical protein